MADTLPTETLTMNYEKVEWTYSKTNDAEDSFDFTGERDQDETAGLLLPAVQQVREGSSLPPDEEDQAVDSFQFAPTTDDSALEPLDALLIINELDRSATDADHDRWIDVLSTDWGTSAPDKVVEAGLRSDGELVQAVSEADMGGDLIL